MLGKRERERERYMGEIGERMAEEFCRREKKHTGNGQQVGQRATDGDHDTSIVVTHVHSQSRIQQLTESRRFSMLDDIVTHLCTSNE